MNKYKREINNIDEYIHKEYILSNGDDICLSLSGILESNKPYHGLYIKNTKVLISNLIEKVEVKNVDYKISDYLPSRHNTVKDEFITLIDMDNNLFEYDINGKLTISKKIIFEHNSDKLCVEYSITNNFNSTVHFKVKPVITYRDIFSTKTSSMLKFNQRKLKNGVLINSSIVDQVDLIIKSKEFDWTKEKEIISDIKTVYCINNTESQTYSEDLLVPGEFDIAIKSGKSLKAYLYITTNDFNIDDVSFEHIYEKNKKIEEMQVSEIENEFVELKDLTLGIGKMDIQNKLITSLPYNQGTMLDLKNNEVNLSKISINTIITLTDIVKSVDGQYLTFNKVKEAIVKLVKVRRYIKEIDMLTINDIEFLKNFVLLKLWYIESVNKILQKENVLDIFFDFTKEMVYYVLDNKNKEKLYNDLEIVCTMFNAIKIYKDMLAKKEIEDLRAYEEDEKLREIIENKFWCEDKRVLRKNLVEEDIYANIGMLYALSLSYPCITGNMQIKLLDTIFKELYTPYGLREFSKISNKNDGLIYPKYMAHFVNANLRQNGVTRASQKIAYNLAKELILDINKYVNYGVKRVYSEKGLIVDSISYDLLTNAEMIRLYDMLT